MYRPLCSLLCLCWLLAAGIAHAAPVTATIDGMRVTVPAPWYIHGVSDPERFSIKRMRLDGQGGDIVGAGGVRVYPLPDRKTLPLARMTPEQLRATAHRFDKALTGLAEPDGPVALHAIQGVAGIARSAVKPGSGDSPEPEHVFTYYFPFPDRLVVLHASVFGNDGDAQTLKEICDSFLPGTAKAVTASTGGGSGAKPGTGKPEARPGAGSPDLPGTTPQPPVTACDGNLSLAFPADWRFMIQGGSQDGGPVWAKLEKQDASDNELTVAEVVVLSPCPKDSRAVSREPDNFLRFPLYGRSFPALGMAATLKNARLARTEPLAGNGLPARLEVYRGTANGDGNVTVEIRDFERNGERLTILTGYLAPLTEPLRKELEGIYASLAAPSR